MPTPGRLRRRLIIALATATAATSACNERPAPLLICHNANCAAPTNPNLDDTMQALRQSLALEWNGFPMLDGIEVDTVWVSDTKRCAFAHHSLSAIAGADAVEPATEIANHLTELGALDPPRRFYIKLEQKPLTAPNDEPHTPDELTAHALCSIDFYKVVAAAAENTGTPLTVLFESEDPALVEAIANHDLYPEKNPGQLVQTGFMIPMTKKPPEGVEVDVVSVNWTSFHEGRARALRDLRGRGIGIMLWMYDADIEVLGTLESMRPDFVTTSEAAIVREWMGHRR